jgi:hypothetical protein
MGWSMNIKKKRSPGNHGLHPTTSVDQKEKLAIFKPVDWSPRQLITAILSFFGKFFM